MDKASQRSSIIQYCQEHGSITNREASERLFINSPTARISEIRKSGLYTVDHEVNYRINSYGKRVKFFRYFITKKEVEE